MRKVMQQFLGTVLPAVAATIAGVGQSGMLSATALDTWIARTAPAGASPFAIAYAPHYKMWFAACGGFAAKSRDGVNWVQVGATFGTNTYFAIAVLDERILLVGNSTTTSQLSVDGETFTATSNVVSAADITVCAGNGIFVVTTSNGVTPSQVATSSDGLTFTNQGTVGAVDIMFNGNSVVYQGGVFTACGSNTGGGPFIATSPDASTASWTVKTTPTGGGWAGATGATALATDGASNWMVGSSGGDTSYSTDDMATWTYKASFSVFIEQIIYSAAFGAFVAVGLSNLIRYTTTAAGAWQTPTTVPAGSGYWADIDSNA